MAYSRIEAHYHSIPDLLSLSCRKFCNLVLEWLMQNCDSDVWNKDYKDIFFGDPEKRAREQEARARIAPAQKGQEGGLNIIPLDAKPVADPAQFFGRAGGAGKSDPNKPAIMERGKRSPLTIGPDADGNLSVSSDRDEG